MHTLVVQWVLDQTFTVDPLSQFSIQPVFHNWCKMMWYVLSCLRDDVKDPLLLIGKSSWLDSAVAKTSDNGLEGTGFASWYWLPSQLGFYRPSG